MPSGPAAAGDSEADIAFAERLHHDHNADVRWCPGLGWLLWDGRRFALDETSQIVARAEESVRRVHLDAYRETNPERRQFLGKLATHYSKIERVRGALEFLKPRVAVKIDDLDSDLFSFNVANGTIDLRTGALRPHDRADLITKLSAIEYSPDAPAPRWEQFLDEVFAGDAKQADASDAKQAGADVIGYVQRLFGYALTASQRDHVLAFLCGPGSNGKSVLTRLMLSVAGEYGQVAPESLFMKQYGDQIPVDVARLRGARLVVASESQEAERLDEGKVKKLSGSDPISARFMRQNIFEFQPSHHLFLQSNHRPVIAGQDFGIWRRIKLINFGVRFADPEAGKTAPEPPVRRADHELAEKLMGELPGILNWAVKGAKEWFESGLRDPKTVIEDTKAYRREEDVLTDFIESRCDVGAELRVDVGSLWTAYRDWSVEEGIKTWSKNKFSRRLTEAGHVSDREAARTKLGIALKGKL